VGDRAGIFHAVSICGPAAAAAVPALVRVLKDPAAKAREQASAALRGVAPGDIDVCTELFEAEDPVARAFGIRGLGDVRSEAGFALLERGARDPAPVVLVAVAEAAKDMGRKALPSVVPLLADERGRVRSAAEDAVEALGAPELAVLIRPRRRVQQIVQAPQAADHVLYPAWLDRFDGSESLFKTLTDQDCGEGVLRAFSTMGLGDEQSNLERRLRHGKGATRRCAALILPRIATNKDQAAFALKGAIASQAADADFVEVASQALRELEN
jgi:HEAT repeat protein